MSVEPSIVVENLTKKYGDFVALNDVSFSIEPGQIVGFLGPNGAGKTTTLKILTCFMAANGGSARVAGHDVYDESEAVRRKIGYLPENVPLYEDMLVYDYLTFIAEVRGVPAAKRHEAVKEAVQRTGLEEMVNRDIFELSKGYRQRVGLAQAILHQPDVIILDEPTSGLDPNQILEIRDLITEIGKEKTVIFSTHILQEVSAVCDRIIVINKGEIVADGTFEELSDKVAEATRGLIVSFDVPKADAAFMEKLAKIKGVKEVFEVEADRYPTFRLATKDETTVRREVLAFAATETLDLVSLGVSRPDLEETFRSLTGGATREERSGRSLKSKEDWTPSDKIEDSEDNASDEEE